jgi:hypothetical protein
VVFDLAQRRPLPHDGDLRVGAPGDVQPGRSRWMPDGSAIVYEALTSDGRFVLVRQPLAAWRGAAAAADTLFPESREIVESFGISPDGRRLVASVVDFLSGLSVAGGVKDIVPPRPPGGSAP